MTTDQPNEQKAQKPTSGGGPGGLSLWFQRRANSRTNARIRRKNGRMMGMDLLILHTVGKRSGQQRESPLAWFPDGDDAWLIVASGGAKRHPDWYFNLKAHPDRVSVEWHGGDPVPVTPHRLDGSDREQAWRRIAEAAPRIAKYQQKSVREYPVIRLTPR